MEIEPFYHDLCRSDMISDEFINQLYILYEQTWNNSISTDFHRIAVFQFRTLRTFCHLTQETVTNHLQTFLQTDFIQSQLFSEESLQIRMSSILTDFIDVTPKTFLRTLTFIQNITAQNLLMTGASVTSVLPRQKTESDTDNIRPYDGITYIFTNGSSCTCSSSTSTTCMGLATFKNEIIPGFQTGCYMLSALLQSTLEVFHNQTYVNLLTNSLNRFQKLNSSLLNETVEELLSQMLVKHWSNRTFFQQYFNACAPDTCQYTIVERNDFLYIITSLIGLFGGLSSILRLIVPHIFSTISPWISRVRHRQNVALAPTVNNQVNRVLLVDRIKRIIIELNFFKSIPPSQNENILRQQRYTTRIYIIILTLSVIIVVLFTSITGQTIHFNIESPSLNDFIDLYKKYPLTLSCPCNQTSMDQKLLSKIQPEYHEICSSQYISFDWINLKFNQLSSTKLYTRDIRFHWQTYFQLLSTLCQMANQTIEDSLQSFYLTKFVTTHALDPQSFQTQINLLNEHFKRTVSESFENTLNLIKTNFEINQFVTPANSVFRYWVYGWYDIYVSLASQKWKKSVDCTSSTDNSGSACFCYSITSEECYQNIIIYGNDTHQSIPGMFQTWFPLHSVLISTLECFYDDLCLTQIESLINSTVSPSNLTRLKSSSSSLFNIETLANNLFIQSWNNQSSFESYFNQCHPLTCQYTIHTQLNVIYIVTTILGLIGGINVVLQLFLPLLVQLILKFFTMILQLKRDNLIRRGRQLCNHLHTLIKSSKRNLVELNLFPTIPPSHDPQIIERNRRTTRIYLILLITALVILTFYGLTRQETILVIVKSPSVSKYRELYSQYSLTLQCPCSQTAIKYNKIITQLEPQYDQICSSVFVSSEWLKSLEIVEKFQTGYSYITDYRDSLQIQFRALAQLCKLSQKTLNTSLLLFGQNDFITSKIISFTEFELRIEAILELFKISVSQQHRERVRSIQLTNYGNQLTTIFSSNWKFVPEYPTFFMDQIPDQTMSLLAKPQLYGEHYCSCGIQSNCSELSYLTFSIYVSLWNQIMPGFLMGCFLFDSLLQSSLICLYNKTCLGLMQAHIYYSKPVKAEILTYSPRSMPNTTIETMLNDLFISEWYQSTSFDSYFNECAPQSCQYSYVMQYNPIYLITMLIGVFGGLTNGLHLLVYYAELIVIKLLNCRQHKKSVAPHPRHSNISVINRIQNTIEEVCIEAVSASQPNTASAQQHQQSRQQHESRRKTLHRVFFIGLTLLAIGGIVASATVVFRNQVKQETRLLTITQTTLSSSESTMTSTEIPKTCHMTFRYQSETYPTGLNPISMVTGDLNKDSIVDLAVTNFDSDTLSVMLGNGNGTFHIPQVFFTGNGSRPREMRIADFNNDTFSDLLVFLSGTKKIVIFFGVATNNLFLLPPYELPFYTYDDLPSAIEVGDINADGLVDILIGRYSNISSFEDRLCIFLNRGDGHQFDQTFSNTYWPTGSILAIVIHDLNQNGNNQVSLSDADSFVRVFGITQYDNILQSALNGLYSMYGFPSVMIKGRFNDDTIDDLALISLQSDTLNVIMSLSSWLSSQQIYITDSYPTAIVPFNFNNDSLDDIAILTCSGTLNVFIGHSAGIMDHNYLSFKINANNTNGECFHSLKVADLNQDAKDDLVFIDRGMNQIRVILGSSCDD